MVCDLKIGHQRSIWEELDMGKVGYRDTWRRMEDSVWISNHKAFWKMKPGKFSDPSNNE